MTPQPANTVKLGVKSGIWDDGKQFESGNMHMFVDYVQGSMTFLNRVVKSAKQGLVVGAPVSYGQAGAAAGQVNVNSLNAGQANSLKVQKGEVQKGEKNDEKV